MKQLPGVVLGMCALVSGCSLYKVARDGDGEKIEMLKGVPFLTRAPVEYQITQLLQTRLKIQYVMAVDGEEYRAPVIPIEVLGDRRGEAQVAAINEALAFERPNNPEAFKKRVNELIRESSSKWSECGATGEVGMICVNPSSQNSQLLSNRLVVRTEISGGQHYINVRRPLIGKATASVEIGADGTLTKSSAEVEGKALETMASILPFTEYVKKVLKLGDYALSAPSGSEGNKINGSLSGSSTKLHASASVTCEIVPETWRYVLENKVSTIGDPLGYDQTTGVELVEASKVEAAGKKSDEADGAWGFSGRVTPPAAQKK